MAKTKTIKVRITEKQYRGGKLNDADWPLPGVHLLPDHAALALIADGLAEETEDEVEVDAEFRNATMPVAGEQALTDEPPAPAAEPETPAESETPPAETPAETPVVEAVVEVVE